MKRVFYFLLFGFIISIQHAGAQNIVYRPDKVAPAENLVPYFERAAKEFNVPVEILMGIGYVESHWRQRIPDESDKHMPPSYGVMGLRNDPYFGYSLKKAASLLHLSTGVLKKSSKENIRGAAAYLSYLSKSTPNISADVDSWQSVIEKYSGIPQPQIAEVYSDDVYNIISKGCEQGHIHIPAVNNIHLPHHKNKKGPSGNNNIPDATPDYSSALWVAASTSNYTPASRPSTYSINLIVMHDMQGSYAGSISWFQNPAAAASAHYLVRSSDGQITQMVQEKDVAWHCGNWAYNTRSIGIEMEGYYDDPSYYSSAAFTAAESLCVYLCNKYSIPKNRQYIIGHSQVPNPNDTTQWGGANHHLDPGGFFNWRSFIEQISGTPSAFTPVKITTGSLNLRCEPFVGSPIITTLALNQEYVQYATASNGWALVFIPGSNAIHYDGWCSNLYLSQDACAPQVEVVNTWPNTLNVTSSYNSAAAVDETSDGQRFVAFGAAQTGTDGNTGWRSFYTPASTGASSGWSTGANLNYIAGGSGTPAVTISVSATNICSGQSITVTPAPVNGGGNPTYNWYVQGTEVGTGNTYTLNNVTSNTSIYCVMTSDANCVSPTTAQSNQVNIVVVGSVPSVPTFTPAAPAGCDSVSVTASSSGCMACTYQWSTPEGADTGANVRALISGAYSVTASDNGCTAANSVNVGVTATPDVSISPADVSICTGGPGTSLTANGNAAGYTWSGNLGSGSVINVNPASTSVYSVTASTGVCSATASATVHVTISATAAISPDSLSMCNGHQAHLSAYPDGDSYIWSGPGNFVDTSKSVAISLTGQYSVTITNPGGCTGVSSATINVAQANAPAINAGNDVYIQPGGQITLNVTANGGAMPYNYKWSPSAGLSADTIYNPVASPVVTTTYLITVTDANNCTSVTSVTVNVHDNICDTTIHPNVVANGPNLIATYYQSATYQWQYNGNPVPDSTRFIQAGGEGYYTVIVTLGGCIYSSSDVFYTGIEQLKLQHFLVEPNPSNGNFVVSFETTQTEDIAIRIFDITGRLLKDEAPVKINGIYTNEISLGNVSKGIYFLQLKSGKKEFDQRLVIY